jgi:signal transduction histidine kinase
VTPFFTAFKNQIFIIANVKYLGVAIATFALAIGSIGHAYNLDNIVFPILLVATIVIYEFLKVKLLLAIENLKKENEHLLKTLVHDIANSMTILNLNISKINSDLDLDTARTKQNIIRAAGNIRLCLSKIKTLRNLNEGKTLVVLEPINLDEMLQNISIKFAERLNSKQLSVRLQLNHGHQFVLSDEKLLADVIIFNLVENAIKYSQPSGLIDISTELNGPNVIIVVRDYGIGIPKSSIKAIFNPNEVSPRPGTTGENGAGFGLPLARSIGLLLEGTLSVDSSESDHDKFKRGSLFRFQIKLDSARKWNLPRKSA